MKNKKGVSTVVATVLIIILVIAAVALIWTPIKNLISSSADEMEAKCLLVEAEITSATCAITTPDDATTADVDETVNTLTITVQNGPQETIDSFQIIYGTEDSLTNTEDDATSLDPNEQTDLTQAVGNTEVTHVKIAPIIDGETCAATSVETVACA